MYMKYKTLRFLSLLFLAVIVSVGARAAADSHNPYTAEAKRYDKQPSEECEKQPHVAKLYNLIGNAYTYFLDYEKGMNYYKKALAFCRKLQEGARLLPQISRQGDGV